MRSGVMSSTRRATALRKGSLTLNVWPFFRFTMGAPSWATSKGSTRAKLRRKTSRSAAARWKLWSMSAQ